MADEEYSKAIKFLRAKSGIKQVDLAKAIGVSPSLVSQWESGWREPSVSEIKKMSVYFKVSTDFILTGKTLKTRTEELEQLKTVQYDFYKYINKEYDLREHPELIREHFEYLESNPEKCKEIPKKYGEWNIVKKVKEIHQIYTMGTPHIMNALNLKKIENKKYTFDVIVQCSPTWAHDYKKVGRIHIQIDFDREIPQYCGEVSFDLVEAFVEEYGHNHFDREGTRRCLIGYLMELIWKVFNENGIGETFLISNSKDNKLIMRECITRKMFYFVIQDNEKNRMFWKYPLDEITDKKDSFGYEIICKYDN